MQGASIRAKRGPPPHGGSGERGPGSAIPMKNTLKYSLHMQKNPVHPEEPEKAYATLQLNGVLDINALAAHMANHTWPTTTASTARAPS